MKQEYVLALSYGEKLVVGNSASKKEKDKIVKRVKADLKQKAAAPSAAQDEL